MGSIPEQPQTLTAMIRRRRARRISLPVEVELRFGNGTTAAVIRDVSFSEEQDSPFIGIGIFHNAPLPLEESLKCHTNTHTDLLPAESSVVLLWTRDFGGDGFLSGGRMQKCVLEYSDDLEPATDDAGNHATSEQMAI